MLIVAVAAVRLWIRPRLATPSPWAQVVATAPLLNTATPLRPSCQLSGRRGQKLPTGHWHLHVLSVL